MTEEIKEEEPLEKKVDKKLLNLQTTLDRYISTVSGLTYLFQLHIENYNKDVSGLTKRVDALEHPDLQESLKAFARVRKAIKYD